MLIASYGHFFTQIPHPMHSVSLIFEIYHGVCELCTYPVIRHMSMDGKINDHDTSEHFCLLPARNHDSSLYRIITCDATQGIIAYYISCSSIILRRILAANKEHQDHDTHDNIDDPSTGCTTSPLETDLVEMGDLDAKLAHADDRA